MAAKFDFQIIVGILQCEEVCDFHEAATLYTGGTQRARNKYGQSKSMTTFMERTI